MRQKVYFTNSKGNKLCGILNNPMKSKDVPLVVLVHGWTSSKDRKTYLLLEKVLEKEGIAAFRFDLYGHGESDGKIEDMTISEGVDDVLSAIKYIRKLGYRRIGLLGSSFGGLCSTIAASKTRGFALILKSPVSEYTQNMLDDKGAQFISEYRKHSGYKAAKSIKCPVLIIHGNSDDRVPLEQSRKISKLLRNCKLKIVKGLTHDYNTKQLKEMASETLDFLKRSITTNNKSKSS